MRRLLVVPVVLVPVAAAGALVWLTGLAWPIGTTAYAFIKSRKVSAYDEPDLVG